MIIIVMGVSGAGKTVVGSNLAKTLGYRFAEGDSFHSAANVEKMRSGTPLTDEDRWPWLHAMAESIDRWRADGENAVLACSALKKVYREILMAGREDVVAVHLEGSHDLIAGRLSDREHEYMPPTLLQSQFDTLEEPDAEENVVDMDIAPEPEKIVANVVSELTARGFLKPSDSPR